MGGVIIWYHKPKKRETKGSTLVVGLPGIGLIGRIAVRYIVDKLKAKKLADFYSDLFPAQALMGKNGKLRLLKQSLYLLPKGSAGTKKPIILLTGDVQPLLPEGQFKLSKKMVEIADSLGVEEIIAIGGYSVGSFKKSPRLLGVVNNAKLIPVFEKLGVVFGEAKGSIVGMAGVIPAFARVKKIPAIAIMGETHGAFVDANMAKKVVELLSNHLGFKVDLNELEAVAKAGEALIKKIEAEVQKAMKRDEPPSYIR